MALDHGEQDDHDAGEEGLWGLSTIQTALTVHLVKSDAAIDDGLLAHACEELRGKFGIAHSTIQLECGDAAHPYRLAPEHVV